MSDAPALQVGNADAALDARLDAELTAYNLEATRDFGVTAQQALTVQVRDAAGDLVAGLSGWTWGEVAGVALLWVHAEHRSEGWGGRLLQVEVGRSPGLPVEPHAVVHLASP